MTQEIQADDLVGGVRVLVEEMAVVTPAMLDAGSAAALAITIEKLPDGKTRFREGVTEDATLTAIWRAMLAAKLGEAT